MGFISGVDCGYLSGLAVCMLCRFRAIFLDLSICILGAFSVSNRISLLECKGGGIWWYVLTFDVYIYRVPKPSVTRDRPLTQVSPLCSPAKADLLPRAPS